MQTAVWLGPAWSEDVFWFSLEFSNWEAFLRSLDTIFAFDIVSCLEACFVNTIFTRLSLLLAAKRVESAILSNTTWS